MIWRAGIKADFGLEVLIAGGEGTRADPFAIERCSARDTVRTQIRLLRGLGHERGEIWRLLSAEDAPEVGPEIQRLRIEAVKFTDATVITDTRAHYFDVRNVVERPMASNRLIVWHHPPTDLRSYYQLGWMQFDSLTENAPIDERLDVTLAYSHPLAEMTLYFYDPFEDFLAAGIDYRKSELTALRETIETMRPDAKFPWELAEKGPFLMMGYHIGRRTSVAGIAEAAGKVVKCRLTFEDGDLKMRQIVATTLAHVQGLVPAR